MEKIRHFDGLRGWAVIIVLLSHTGFGDLVPGGLGVEIFFVMSGYLIMTISAYDLSNRGAFDVNSFLIKRIFRLFPTLFVTYFIFYCINAVVVFDNDVSIQTVVSQLLFFSNYNYLYFDGRGLAGSGVLWSLAVEVHFYISFALLFVICAKYHLIRFRWIVIFIFSLLLIVRALNYFVFNLDYEHFYYSTDSRVTYIFFGVILSIFFEWQNQPYKKPEIKDYILYVLSTVLILLSFLVRSDSFRFFWRDYIHILCFCGVFRLLLLHRQAPFLNIIFENKIIVEIGRQSYYIYLVHAFLLQLFKHAFGNYLDAIWMTLAVFFVSYIYAKTVCRMVDSYSSTLKSSLLRYFKGKKSVVFL